MTSKLPKEGFIRIKQLIGSEENSPPIIPVSAAPLWSWVRDNKFPKPLKLSDSITVWRVEDVREFIESRGQL